MKKQLWEVPKFASESIERDFWASADSTDYVDWSNSSRASFPDLKPSLKTISLRMSEPRLNRIKAMANERDVPYQSLIKIILSERIAQELGSQAEVSGAKQLLSESGM
jgi:predicted DNA binding CopG/RHH family protein